MQQHTTTPACVTAGNISTSDPPNGSTQKQVTSGGPSFGSSASQVTALSTATPNTSFASVDTDANVFSVPLDGACMKFDSLGTANYVGSSHWAAILDSIAELREHFEHEEEIRNTTIHNPVDSSWPQLLYGCQQATELEILSSIPPRRVADRLVSRYFALDIASGKQTLLKVD